VGALIRGGVTLRSRRNHTRKRRIEPVKNQEPKRPDFETTEPERNGGRAERARAALDAYVGGDGERDPQTSLQDLLSDLEHLCVREGYDFDALLGRAREAFLEEAEAELFGG
jgi:hypothetical protein